MTIYSMRGCHRVAHRWGSLLYATALALSAAGASTSVPRVDDPAKTLREAVDAGRIAYKLTEPEELIAIFDQPLLLGHEEYTSRLIRYDATQASWFSPQSHGSPIAGIAVGQTCGVAPHAFVFYYASPTSMEHRMQADYIREIVKHNESAGASGRIRVISISASPEEERGNEAFMRARKEALDAGILVVTCSDTFLRYGCATLIEGRDPDKPESYRPGRYAGPGDMLLMPAANKTMASYQGANVYTYERDGGMSWAVPYIAGLAALAFQVNPDLQPQTVVEQLVKTATRTEAGPIVNPRGFIESVKRP